MSIAIDCDKFAARNNYNLSGICRAAATSAGGAGGDLDRTARGARHPDAALAPHAEPAQEGEVVVAEPRALRHFVELAGVAAAEHDIICFQCGPQGLDHLLDGAAPFLGTQTAAAAVADIVFVGPALFVVHMGEFHRLHDSVEDHRRPQARPQAEEQHAAALVAADGLHGRIVDDPHGPAEGPTKVETHPAPAQIMGFGHDLAVNDDPRVADRHHVVLPVAYQLKNAGDHAGCAHLRT